MDIVPSHKKLGIILENKVFQKLLIEKIPKNKIKKCAPNLIFLNEKSKKGPDGFYRKLTL
jgi:hypothetical protein